MEVVERSQDKCNVIYHPHPIFTGRDCKYLFANDGDTVRELLVRAGVDTKQPIVISLDDRLLKVSEWDVVCPKVGQIINVKATVMGGGGGGGSNPMQTVAMVALVITAAVLAAPTGGASLYLAGAMGISATTAGALIGAGMMMAGSMLINSVFAANPPSASMGAMSGQYAEASPTYSLSGGSNRMRPYESMPVIFGQIQFFPDLAARPYTEYQGSDQYLYQIFHFGLSDAEYSDFRIGTTSLSDYTDVTWKLPDSDGKIAGFPGNVDSIQGVDLTNSAGWATRTSSLNTYRIGIDIESVLYYANNSGGMDSTAVNLRAQIKKTSESNWASPANAQVSGGGVNIDGGNITLTGNSQKPIRATIFIYVPVGEYDVRVIRDTADSTDARLQNKTSWSTLRSYQEDNATYEAQHRRGLIIKATSQLNGSIQQLSCKATAKATYWNGSSWVTAATRNPAHWFMDFAVGKKKANGKLIYGAGRSRTSLDLAGLHSWAQFCDAEGLTFDAVLDGSQTVQDFLNSIARCGFGSMTLATGKLGVVWDDRNPPVSAAYGMSNIIAGSFEVTYLTENLAEEIIVRYSNPDKDFIQDEVRVIVPGVDNPTRTSSVDLYGCANKAMAGKFANYLAAQQKYRTRRIKWDCDFEGFTSQRGDCVILSHDLTQWGYSGRIVEHNGNKITIDRRVPIGSDDYIIIKRPDGEMLKYKAVGESLAGSDELYVYGGYVNSGYIVGDDEFDGTTNILALDAEPDFQSGTMDMDHMWFFSPMETVGKKVKILSVQPQSESRIQIIATDEYEEFYEAWDGTWNEAPQSTLLLSGKPVISNLYLQESLYKKTAGIVSRVVASFSVSGFYDSIKIRYRFNGGEWVNDVSLNTNYEFDAMQTGNVTVEVCPVSGITAGDAVSKTINLYGLLMPPANVTSFNAYASDSGIIVTFDPCPDVDWAYTEIRSGDDWANATPVVKALSNKYSAGWLPAGIKKYHARNVDTTGNSSVEVASTSISISKPSSVNINRAEVQENSVALGWGDSKTSQPISGYAIYIGNEGQSFEDCTLYGKAGADSRSDIVIFRSAGKKVIWMTATDVAGNTSDPLGINVSVTLPTNFILANEYDFNWALGDVVNGDIDGGSLYLPIKSETWQSHFSSRGYTDIQDQVDAGYPSYFQPSETTGSYTELHDIGKVVSIATISVTPIAVILSGSITPDILIEWSLDGSTWGNSGGNVTQAQATNLRYVRVTYSVTALGGDDLVRLDRIHVTVSTSTVNEFGSLTLSASDVAGTPYICNVEFLDIISAVATPNNSANIKTINVIISDSTNPSRVFVQAWDYSNNRTGGTVSINIGGY